MADIATKEQADQAVIAVKNGNATREQQQIAEREAKQAGSRGNAARDAFQKGR